MFKIVFSNIIIIILFLLIVLILLIYLVDDMSSISNKNVFCITIVNLTTISYLLITLIVIYYFSFKVSKFIDKSAIKPMVTINEIVYTISLCNKLNRIYMHTINVIQMCL